jgi:hypothetical protein
MDERSSGERVADDGAHGQRVIRVKPHPPAGASYRDAKREEPLGCLGSFCAMLGITPARVQGRRGLEREAEAQEPRVIRAEGDGAGEGSGRGSAEG